VSEKRFHEMVCGDDVRRVAFTCPGCGWIHSFVVERPQGDEGPIWAWNNDMDEATFSPSLLYRGNGEDRPRCHVFVGDGMVRFLPDTQHALSGITTLVPPWGETH
jgi:hypothetical protein